MTHIFFDQDKIDWGPYLQKHQVGDGFVMQGRGGMDSNENAKVFRGLRYTRGYGFVGNMLGSIGRFLLPVASNIAESAKHEAIKSLGLVAGEAAAGKPLIDSFKEEAKAMGNRLGQKIQQCGKGRKRKKKFSTVNSVLPELIKTVGGSRKRKQKNDYLDFN